MSILLVETKVLVDERTKRHRDLPVHPTSLKVPHQMLYFNHKPTQRKKFSSRWFL
jgi:hypothetical protein